MIIILLCLYSFIGGFLISSSYREYLIYKENKKKDFSNIKNFFLKKQELVLEEPPEELWDVVYILKNDIDENTKELTYSLRSLKNFKYKKVWFAGGQPKNLSPDMAMPIKQVGKNKMERVVYTLKQICQNNELSENFWIFNDDFFVMKPHKQYEAYSNGTIQEVIDRITNMQRSANYMKILKTTVALLKDHKLPIKNYALHTPMLVNKKMVLEVLEKFPTAINFRNVYGNYYQLESKEMEDEKYFDNKKPINKEAPYLSTWERSFASGMIGRYIREQFPEKSRFEK